MSRNVRFQLNLAGGAEILQNIAASAVNQSANAIAGRARSNAASLSSKPPKIDVYSSVGVIKRGSRAIAVVKGGGTQRDVYIATEAIRKAKDAGKLS